MITLDERAAPQPPVDKATSLGAHFRALTASIPNRTAITFLERGEEEGGTLTFEQVDQSARSLAAFLQERKGKGARAIMLFETCVEILPSFLGCVYAEVIAIPMPAPVSGRIDFYLERVKNVAADADAQFVLTTSATMARLQRVASVVASLQRLEWIAVDQLPDRGESWVPGSPQMDDVVYLQYTSGSTSDPKGVMVTQGSLMCGIHYCGTICRCATEGTRAVTWLPYCHDLGLIHGILTPLAYGMSVYLMSPLAFVQKPIRWLNAIHRYRASHSAGPNFALDLAAAKTTPAERRSLDLRCWRNASIGGEPIRSSTVRRFVEAFGPHGFSQKTICAGWGLAEATLVVTASDDGPKFYDLDSAELEQNRIRSALSNRPSRTLVGAGRLWDGPWNLDVKIVNPQTFELTPYDEVGEIWVTGDIVAKGYWNRPTETGERFRAEIAGIPGVHYLRTGDLGFIEGNELVFTGRLKDLIIVEGRKHYPQEIEKTAEASHPCLRPHSSIAFSIEPDTQDPVRVILVCALNKGYRVSDRDAGLSEKSGFEPQPIAAPDASVVFRGELVRAIRRAVADEHQLRIDTVAVVPAGCIPKTTSGKLQRSRCKKTYLDGELPQL